MRRLRCPVVLVVLGLVACAPPIGTELSAGPLRMRSGVAWGVPSASSLTVGFVLENQGAQADTLVAVASGAGMAMLHDTSPQGMVARDVVPVPAGEMIVLGLEGAHIMITAVAAATWTAERVPVTLHFRRAGAVEVVLPILQYSEAIQSLRRAAH